MADGDWLRFIAQSGFSLLSGAAGLLIGIWHAGKRSGKQEAELEAKIMQDVEVRLQEEMKEMKVAFAAAADNRDLLVGQFQESFAGLRRQMDENRLQTEQQFVRKDAFKEFRDENNEKLQRMDEKLDKLLMARRQ